MRRTADILALPYGVTKPAPDPSTFVGRHAISIYEAARRGQGSAADYAEEVLQDDGLAYLLRHPKLAARALVEPETTTDPVSAAPLAAIGAAREAFVELLRAESVVARLATRTIDLGREAGISIPRQISAPQASWVAEGQPIPVRRQGFDQIVLQPRKIGVLVPVSSEMMRSSSPAIQQLVTDDLVAAVAEAYDGTFLGSAPASVTQPAGLQAMVPAGNIQATAGPTVANVAADVAFLVRAVADFARPNSQYVWLMSEANRAALETARNPLGQLVWPAIRQAMFEGRPVLSSAAAPDILALVDAREIFRLIDRLPMIELSSQATIHMDDAPTGDIGPGGGATTPVVSMYQTDQTALRLTGSTDWGMRRAGAGAVVTGVVYGE